MRETDLGGSSHRRGPASRALREVELGGGCYNAEKASSGRGQENRDLHEVRRDLAEELTGKKWSWVGWGLWRSTVIERETGPRT